MIVSIIAIYHKIRYIQSQKSVYLLISLTSLLGLATLVTTALLQVTPSVPSFDKISRLFTASETSDITLFITAIFAEQQKAKHILVGLYL